MLQRGPAWTGAGRRLRGLRRSDAAGVAAAVTGAALVAAGIALQDRGVDAGAPVRMLGGILVLGGVGVVLLGESRRRAAANDAARRAVARYMSATGRWRRPNRLGLALSAIGLLLYPPALVVQILFGTAAAILVIAPGIALFWGGVALIVATGLRRALTRGRGAEPPDPSGRP